MLLTQAGVVSALLARGLIDAGSIVDGDLVVVDASRRNISFKVLSERGPSYFVKQGVGDDRRRTVAHEAAVYDLVAASPTLEPLARRMPRRRLYDAEDCTLVVELVRGGETIADRHRRRRRVPAAIGRALGRTLGTLHRLTRPGAAPVEHLDRLRSHTPTLFGLHRPSLAAFTWMSSATLEIVKTVQRSEALSRALDAVRREWRTEALIHGDARWDNCLWVAAGGGAPDLTLIDWEMAGAGDPCWDVGTAFSEYVGAWLLSSPLVPEMPAERMVRLSPFPLASVQRAIRGLWRSYVREMALEPGQDDEWCLRAVRYAGARLIEMACESALSAARATEDAVYLLQMGANILERPLDAAGDLFGLPVLPAHV